MNQKTTLDRIRCFLQRRKPKLHPMVDNSWLQVKRHDIFYGLEKPSVSNLRGAYELGVINQREYARIKTRLGYRGVN